MRKFIIAILTAILFTSCFGLFDSGSDKVVDEYEVIWIDVQESRSLKKGETLVPAYVFAVGHDSKYIYSKQHPLLENSKEKINREITNYYIIERTESIFQDKPVFGPFNKTNFEKKCRELRIENPEFNVTFPTKWHF